jgi:hypothetical protein
MKRTRREPSQLAKSLFAIGITTLKQFTDAEEELERFGLITVDRQANGDHLITLCDHGTGLALEFPKQGR